MLRLPRRRSRRRSRPWAAGAEFAESVVPPPESSLAAGAEFDASEPPPVVSTPLAVGAEFEESEPPATTPAGFGFGGPVATSGVAFAVSATSRVAAVAGIGASMGSDANQRTSAPAASPSSPHQCAQHDGHGTVEHALGATADTGGGHGEALLREARLAERSAPEHGREERANTDGVVAIRGRSSRGGSHRSCWAGRSRPGLTRRVLRFIVGASPQHHDGQEVSRMLATASSRRVTTAPAPACPDDHCPGCLLTPPSGGPAVVRSDASETSLARLARNALEATHTSNASDTNLASNASLARDRSDT